MQGAGDQARFRRGKKKVAHETKEDQPVGWTGWRGPESDGRVPTLPAKLPRKPTIVWRQPLSGKGLGGVAATKDYVLVSDKELMDTTDVYRCLQAKDGKELWTARQLAAGDLDYGNSSRATPLIWKDLVFFYSAFGTLQCFELATGKSVWDLDLCETFAAVNERRWGFSTSPLIVEDKLIINPGGKDASLAALEPKTGKIIWKTPGKPASYGNFLAGTFGGVKQVIGWDQDSLGGWNVAAGQRLWEFKPKNKSVFNVPTPLAWGDKLAVAIENNGTYLFRFKEKGILDPQPLARYADLAPDTHTPVLATDRVFGMWNGLHCLDLKNDLKRIYLGKDTEFNAYCSVVASADRVLVTTLRGELILLDAKADEFKVLGRLQVLEEERGCYAHPAFVGPRVYMRGADCILCVDLSN